MLCLEIVEKKIENNLEELQGSLYKKEDFLPYVFTIEFGLLDLPVVDFVIKLRRH